MIEKVHCAADVPRILASLAELKYLFALPVSNGGNARASMTFWLSPSCNSSGYNSQVNRYNSPAPSQPNTTSYHYSNNDGSYYYSNSNGSTYYNNGRGYSQYTTPSGDKVSKFSSE
ncbi:hypothetical protein AC1031_009616 [Aphanomyces cochlioides]|nr:hypothetical protein AC1031_009616 [Aphanomyces cochlioides]